MQRILTNECHPTTRITISGTKTPRLLDGDADELLPNDGFPNASSTAAATPHSWFPRVTRHPRARAPRMHSP